MVVEAEPGARTEMEIGELAVWPDGNAFCIFFGPTPVSRAPNPRLLEGHPIGRVLQSVGAWPNSAARSACAWNVLSPETAPPRRTGQSGRRSRFALPLLTGAAYAQCGPRRQEAAGFSADHGVSHRESERDLRRSDLQR